MSIIVNYALQNKCNAFIQTLKTFMKRQLVAILLLFSLTATGQINFVDQVEFTKTTDSTIHVYKKLKIKDTQSAIITISYAGLWTDGQYLDHFIFYPNGKVKYYEEFISRKDENRSFLRKHRLGAECRDSIFKLINHQLTQSKFKYDQDSLSFIPEPIETDSSIIMIPTADGLTYSMSIIQGKRYVIYSSFSPESLIASKSPGYKEKKRFLELYKEFEKIKNCY